MATVVFVSWWGGGNMTPVLALGPPLVQAGHDVTVVGPPSFASRLSLDGVALVPTASVTASIDEVREAAEQLRPDLLAVDFMMGEVLGAVPALAGARATAALVHTMWQPVADREWDNVAAFFPLARINDVRRMHGLPAVDHAVEILRDLDHVLVSMPEPLDRPRRSEWPSARYLGPLFEPPQPWTPPGEPLVVVSLGTTPMGEEPLFRQVLEALGGLDAQVFATVGDHLDPTAFDAPPNTTVGAYTRHAGVLPHASAVVSHGGLGTVIAAATVGVPQVCLPLGRDQPGNARRVEELGVGVVAEPAELPAAVAHVLSDAHIHRAARSLAEDIRAHHPDPVAAFTSLL